MPLKIKNDVKNLLNKITSQFSKSGYDERWANLEIQYDGKRLSLIGGGLGIIIVACPEIEGTEQQFTGQVDLRRFFETIKFMGKNVKISFTNDVILKKDNRVVTFKVINNTFDHMLPIPIQNVLGSKDGVKMEMYSDYLKNLIEFVIDDEHRPQLQCIYVNNDNDSTYYTATDGHHLIEIKTKMKHVEPFLIDKSVPFPIDEDIYVRKIKNRIIYNTDSWIVYQNIINNNEYPDYRIALKRLYGEWKTFSVNRKDMIYALTAAMGFAGGKISAAITMQVNGDMLSLTSRNVFNVEPDIYNDKIKISNYDKIDLEVTFFTKYFLDGIVASGEDEVLLNVAKNDCIFITENDRRILLFPIKKD